MSALLVLGEMTLTRIFQRPLLMHQQPFLWSMVAGNSHFYGCWSLTTTIYHGRWQITVTSDHFQSSKFSHCNSRTFADHVRWRRTSQESPTLEARESAHCRFCAGVCSGTFLLTCHKIGDWVLICFKQHSESLDLFEIAEYT